MPPTDEAPATGADENDPDSPAVPDETGAGQDQGSGDGDGTEGGDALGDAGRRALDAERTARRDAVARAAQLETDLGEAETRVRAEVERELGEARTVLEGENSRLTTENAALRAALAHGLSVDDLDLLGTGTADEITARAERLAARLGERTGPRRPAPDPAQGSAADPSLSAADAFAAALSGP